MMNDTQNQKIPTPTEELNHSDVPNPLFEVEKTNRIVLILFLSFLVLSFMDYQAKKHYDNLKSSSEILENTNYENDEELVGNEDFLRKEAELAPKIIEKTQENAQIIPKKAKDILGSINKFTKKIQKAAKNQQESEISPSHAILKKTNNVPPTPNTVNVSLPSSHYFLYFIKFDGKKSKIVRVKRYHKGKSISLLEVLQNLERGPKSVERNLLNNFSYVQIHSIRKVARSIVLDLSPNIGRMGPHVIRDRLEQLSQTLCQFREIDYISLLINGIATGIIGNSKFPLPKKIKPKQVSFDFKE